MLLRGKRPPYRWGAAVAICSIAASTGLIYVFEGLTTVSALGVVYLVGVIIISAIWGLWLGIATSVLSAAAFNFFHLPPVARFTISDSRNWAALAAFLVVAVTTSTVGELARARASEAERRRDEADLTAEMARMLLRQVGVEGALTPIGQRLAAAFDLPWATIMLLPRDGDERHEAIPLRSGSEQLGTLIIPIGLRPGELGRLRERIVPALVAVLEVAIERERLVAEAVQTEALRRTDKVKTAVLRSVSHDLRSPVTAMVAAGSAVRAPGVSEIEREELGGLVVDEGARLSRLIDDLLDLSRLESEVPPPQPAECSVEEVVDSALADQLDDTRFDVRIDPGLDPVKADFTQLERAVANLLENAARYGGTGPVRVRARANGARLQIRIVDQGPGISAAEQDRIFQPFYRGEPGDDHTGSGLGLAIAKGFVETNGGRLGVESTVGQGTSFVIDLPIAAGSQGATG